MHRRFDNYLGLARSVQAEVYGLRPDEMPPLDFQRYVLQHFHCAHVELAEASQELPLKEWRGDFCSSANLDPGARSRAIVELVDTLCHVSNVLVALGVDDDELEVAYEDKVALTRERDGGRYEVVWIDDPRPFPKTSLGGPL